MERDAAAILEAIVAAIEDIREAAGSKTFEEFRAARIERLAIERAIEIVCRRRHGDCRPTFSPRHPDIEWPKVKAIGNVLRHEYHRISDKVIWDVLQYELDKLEGAVRAELHRALRGD